MRHNQKVIIHTAMSLDGFVAGPGDDMRWVFAHPEPSLDLSEHIAAIGAVVMGGKTQAVDIKQRPKPEKNFVYGGQYGGPVFVLSEEPNSQEQDPRVQYISGDITEKIKDVIKKADGGNVVLLGATVWKECLAAGLVDEILVHIVPVLLGDGVRLYAVPGARQVELELVESRKIGKLAEVRFKVSRRGSGEEKT